MPGMTAKGQQAGPLPPGEQFYLDRDGFEGTLDMLLPLAQAKKLDLSTISLRAAAGQYLRFIGQARVLQLEQAGEYLQIVARLIYINRTCFCRSKRKKRIMSANQRHICALNWRAWQLCGRRPKNYFSAIYWVRRFSPAA